MRNMLRKLLLAPAVMAVAALATNPAMAESAKVAQVPFNFAVAGHMCPAGRYLISRNFGSNIVELSSEAQPIHYMWTVAPGDPSPSDARVLLTFDVQGANHTLHTVQYQNMVTSSLDGRRLSLRHGSDLIVPGE